MSGRVGWRPTSFATVLLLTLIVCLSTIKFQPSQTGAVYASVLHKRSAVEAGSGDIGGDEDDRIGFSASDDQGSDSDPEGSRSSASAAAAAAAAEAIGDDERNESGKWIRKTNKGGRTGLVGSSDEAAAAADDNNSDDDSGASRSNLKAALAEDGAPEAEAATRATYELEEKTGVEDKMPVVIIKIKGDRTTTKGPKSKSKKKKSGGAAAGDSGGGPAVSSDMFETMKKWASTLEPKGSAEIKVTEGSNQTEATVVIAGDSSSKTPPTPTTTGKTEDSGESEAEINTTKESDGPGDGVSKIPSKDSGNSSWKIEHEANGQGGGGSTSKPAKGKPDGHKKKESGEISIGTLKDKDNANKPDGATTKKPQGSNSEKSQSSTTKKPQGSNSEKSQSSTTKKPQGSTSVKPQSSTTIKPHGSTTEKSRGSTSTGKPKDPAKLPPGSTEAPSTTAKPNGSSTPGPNKTTKGSHGHDADKSSSGTTTREPNGKVKTTTKTTTAPGGTSESESSGSTSGAKDGSSAKKPNESLDRPSGLVTPLPQQSTAPAPADNKSGSSSGEISKIIGSNHGPNSSTPPTGQGSTDKELHKLGAEERAKGSSTARPTSSSSSLTTAKPSSGVATEGGCKLATARPDCQCNYKEMKDTDKMLAVVVTKRGGFKGRRLGLKAIETILANKLTLAQEADLVARKTTEVSTNNTYVLPAGHYYFPRPVRVAGFVSP